MQSAHNAANGTGVVILDEFSRQPELFEQVRTKNFRKEPAIVLEHLRNQDTDLTQMPRFNS
jgi:hypothetical protein